MRGCRFKHSHWVQAEEKYMNQSKEIFRILNFISEPELQDEILRRCHLISAEKGDTIVREGEYVKILPIVIEGTIRVFQSKEDREILLYYVEQSQTCMMSLSASFFNHSSSIEAIAITPTKILAVPIKYIAEWQKKYSSWNNFVLKTFRKRYDELLQAFESVAFDHVDKRILEYLQCRKSRQESRIVKISHLELAKELGTTRVVVSRILKQFELENKVKLHRGSIELL